MSSLDDKVHLKAGHPPAVKAGCRRIFTRHRMLSQSEKSEIDEEFPEIEPISKSEARNIKQNVSGAITKGDKDFKEAAIKRFHDKQTQTHEKRPVSSSNQRIQQP